MAGTETISSPYSSANIPEYEPSSNSTHEQQLLRWLNTARLEGEAVLKAEPAYDDMDRSISYVMGDQMDPRRPVGLANISDNRFKHIVLQTVAALTDIHPVFGFKTFNERFLKQSTVLDKLTRSWWMNSFADLRLADVIRYAAVLGTGYVEIQWDPVAARGVGDIKLIPRDPRDIVPIRPSLDPDIQTWEGIIIKTSQTINELKYRYPGKSIVADRAPNVFTRTWTRARRAMTHIISPSAVDVLTQDAPQNAVTKIPSADVYYTYVKDRRKWKGEGPIIMGDPKTDWAYPVYPKGFTKPNNKPATDDDSRLFPRGRLIISTKRDILYDGPNPYWHGMFPVARLQLDPWPWSLLGPGLGKDLLPLQDTINEIYNGILDAVRKALRPAIIGDKKAMPESQWQRTDTRLAGLKFKTNPATGKGVEFVDPPALPNYVPDMLQFTMNEMDTLSGVANLTALTQLKQAPGADTIEKMMESLTPVLRLRGRLLESFLRAMGEMVMAMFFQFYNLPRRVQILGEDGISMDDFDFDPGTLVPAVAEGEDEYDPNLDSRLHRADRAKWHMKNFTFQITPNSLLSISQISRKLTYLQLWRGGLMDPWSLFEALEIPNGGMPPKGASTITERLQAANEMGLTGTVSPAGRKATGQTTPSLQVKDEGGVPRVTVSESGSGGGRQGA
jgi:hypothetical protein